MTEDAPGSAVRGRRGAVRTVLRGVAAQPRGDAPAWRRPARPAAPAGPSGRRRGRRRPLRLPDGSLAPAGRHPAQLPDDRVRHDRGGTCRDPAPQRAPPRDHRAGLFGARSGPVAVGPRHPRRVHDRRLRRLAGAALDRPPRGLLRGDATDRPGVRRARDEPPGGPRGVRAIRRGDARPGRPGPRLAGGARARRRRAPAAARPACDPAAAPGRPGGRRPAAHPGRCLRLDPVAVRRPAAAVRPRGLRAVVGTRGADGVGLARRRLAGLASAAAGRVPADGEGTGGGPTGSPGRAPTPTRRRSSVSRSAGSAGRTASARDRATSRRRARGAASRS